MLLPINYRSVLECAQSFVLASEQVLNVYAYHEVDFLKNERFSNFDNLKNSSFLEQLDAATDELTRRIQSAYTVSTFGVYGMAGSGSNPCIGIVNEAPFVLTDCSGFINHVVSHVSGGVGAALNAHGDKKLADDYATQGSDEFFVKQNITALKDGSVNIGPYYIARGSILAWSLPKDEHPTDTGHVMVVAEDTVLHTTGETQYLTIIDCSEVRADKSSGVSQRTISMKPYDGRWHVSLACDDDPQSELDHINVLRLK
ncbi:hypothetical protein SAMN04488518_11333 [Pseudovibrio ascidiaceicola]|uniref:Uncharacterized protein n=1 Tax=Pseudovibrio ascidiaceicola TaxID=285279 RepID=A0A1I4E0V3_9HYPH|nr:hypothetical protein [Pseudovibrio ascidiaceicola]SFK97996.1 hypothetical protein SAMN04488518_11333 [Pseudovibrio ascidiaceicola]